MLWLAISLIIGCILVFAWKNADHIERRLLGRSNRGVKIGDQKALEYEAKHSVDSLSWPARQVLQTYNRIPQESRPSYNVEAALRALDKKYGMPEVNAHFIDYSTSHYYGMGFAQRFSWGCDCKEDTVEDTCEFFPEYDMMHDAALETIRSIQAREEAHRERERQMELAGLEPDLRTIPEIVEALRNERAAIDSVTEELRGSF